MDKRNSKETMLERISELEIRLEKVYRAGVNGIAHVGAANYYSRQCEAEKWVFEAMNPDLEYSEDYIL